MLRFKPTKLSLALFTVHLFNPVDPLNVSGLAKGSQKITLKTTRLVSKSACMIFWQKSDKSVSGWEAEVKYEKWKEWPCGKKCFRQKRDRHHISQWSPLQVQQPPPSPNPQSEKQSMLPNQVIRTGRSKLVSNQGPCRLVIFASELSPDVFTLQVKNGHLRQN